MKMPWFKRIGLFFIPVAFAGWILLLAALVYAVYEFRVIDRHSHSASDTLMNFAVQLVFIGIVYSVIAFLTSRRYKRG